MQVFPVPLKAHYFNLGVVNKIYILCISISSTLRGNDSPPREITMTWKYLSSILLGATFKGKNLGAKFFPLIIAPFFSSNVSNSLVETSRL